MNKIRAAITGVGGYVPDYILTNKELETMVDTNDEWITSRTGIKERRILKGENQGVSVMGIAAVKEMLSKTKTDPKEIDLLIFATVTADMTFPATANIVATAVGATNAFSYDLSAACSGFLFALTTGASFIESGLYKKVIVVGGDKMSAILDYTDRKTCIIFGDGAGCVLLEPTTENVGVMDSILKSDGNGESYLHMKAGGSRIPASHESVADRIAADDHLDREFGADRAREPLGTAGTRQQAELHFGQAELGFLGRDAIVACQSDFKTAAERRAVNGGNDRLRRVLHQDKHFRETWGLRRLAEFGDVGAGDEGAACAGQHDRLNFRVRNRALHAFEDAAAYRRTQRVDRRTVDRDDGDDVMTLEFYHFVHGTLPGSLVLECCTTCVE